MCIPLLLVLLIAAQTDPTEYFLQYRTAHSWMLDRSNNPSIVSVAANGFAMSAWAILAGLTPRSQEGRLNPRAQERPRPRSFPGSRLVAFAGRRSPSRPRDHPPTHSRTVVMPVGSGSR